MSKCQRYYEIISAFVDSQANALEQLALQEHLKSCNTCKNELASQYALKDMMRSYQAVHTDLDLSSNIMRQIRYKRQEDEHLAEIMHYQAKVPNRWVALGVMFAMTATALFLGSGSTVYAQKPDPAKEYASYIYQHVNDEEYRSSYQPTDNSIKQVSFIR
ncbi:MAG: zf-HC2 domain-containing protein [Deferribacteraceae bacterium]|nr:zf-HC2 domain-containing protein [Deferribacteraceae bacterium]